MTISRAFHLVTQSLLVLIFVLSFIVLLKPLTSSYWQDFSVYYTTARAVFSTNSHSTSVLSNYLYPPISLLLFYPFTFLNFEVAGKIWTFFSLSCLFISLWIFLKQYKKEKSFYTLLLSGIFVFIFFPVKFTLGMGQLNLIILLVITLCLSALHQNKPRFAGVLLGVALTLKYFPLLIFVYLVIRRMWKTLIAMILTIIALFCIGFFLFAHDVTANFFQSTFPTLATSLKADYYNQALSGFLLRDFSFRPLQYNFTRIVLSLVMLTISAWVIYKKKFDKKFQSLEFGIFLTLSLLLSTFSWQHHFALLLLPLGVTYFTLQRLKASWKYYAILVTSYLLVAINAKNPQLLPVILQSHVFWGTFLLWAFDLYIFYKYSPDKI